MKHQLTLLTAELLHTVQNWRGGQDVLSADLMSFSKLSDSFYFQWVLIRFSQEKICKFREPSSVPEWCVCEPLSTISAISVSLLCFFFFLYLRQTAGFRVRSRVGDYMIKSNTRQSRCFTITVWFEKPLQCKCNADSASFNIHNILCKLCYLFSFLLLLFCKYASGIALQHPAVNQSISQSEASSGHATWTVNEERECNKPGYRINQWGFSFVHFYHSCQQNFSPLYWGQVVVAAVLAGHSRWPSLQQCIPAPPGRSEVLPG